MLCLIACSSTSVTEIVANKNTVDENKSSMDNESVSVSDVKFMIASVDRPVYENADELTEAAAIVLLGKITEISFQIFDIKTGKPPAVDSEKNTSMLHTIYDIETVVSYKGNTSKTLQACMTGGL